MVDATIRCYLRSNDWNLVGRVVVRRALVELKEPIMDIPLLIAILALLTWTLLPQLDRYADADLSVEGKPSRLQRLARWINN